MVSNFLEVLLDYKNEEWTANNFYNIIFFNYNKQSVLWSYDVILASYTIYIKFLRIMVYKTENGRKSSRNKNNMTNN